MNYRYNWAGDFILRDTIVANKRAVVGYIDEVIPTDVREWVKEPPNNKLSEALSDPGIGLPQGRGTGTFDRRAYLIWEYVAKKVEYVYDKRAHGMPDFWFFPEETLSLGKGDCEDSTFLLCSLLLASGISPFCVRAELGRVYDENGNLLGGHAWPCYWDEQGNWRLLESTLDKVPERMPLADSFTLPDIKFQYEPLLCFNQCHLWLVKPLSKDEEKVEFLGYYCALDKANIHKRR